MWLAFVTYIMNIQAVFNAIIKNQTNEQNIYISNAMTKI